ncbi:MAG: bifunctional UDP-N-acetylmuramoyl-tripeptide:D-alanyl-D-alanine ligase/alanine racemase [Tannerellaceae bacterium]|jgi:alanine racemase|nr:bifunctional UDP-N-acetylmuramoyl-tripeptide:D-alanyl-D-alanine ligase/alanine racemase [Tannerellaceae bacterium]
MEYTIQEIERATGANALQLHDHCVSIILTDSRRLSMPAESIFFAIKTRTNNGHKYIRELYDLRVRCFVVSEPPANMEEMPEASFLQVKDTVKALQRLAAYHRSRFDIPVAAIAGSNGKTVVKEFLYQLLRRDFNIVRSPMSYNSQVGVPVALWEMSPKHNLAIFEAGISQPDEMDNLRPMIEPNIGIFTGLGEAHQENFVSMHQKCMEKLSLFTKCQAVVYNSDNAMVNHCMDASLLSHRTVAWSRIDDEAPVFVEAINKRENDTEIICSVMGIPSTYIVPFTDDASIENIMHCITFMTYIKPTSLRDAKRFASLEAVDMRVNVREGVRNCLLINDMYNSDFNSLESALNFMRSRQADRRDLGTVLILSDILQSGALPKSLYKRVADLVRRKKVERIIGIGRDIYEHASLFNIGKEFYRTTDDFLVSDTFRTFRDSIILLKGSRRFNFERISTQLEKRSHETVLEVSLDAVVHNYNYFRSLLNPDTRIIAMVKAFGYGAGAHELAKTLQQQRCDYLAVAVADEGAALRREGISIPIMVMNPEPSCFHVLFDNHLEPEVYSFRMLDALIMETLRRGITSYPAHIKFNTGMNRLGFDPSDVEEICRRLRTQSGITVRSAFSHLAAADSAGFDDFSLRQARLFAETARKLEAALDYKIFKHILNSAGIERFPQYQMDMVRLGIGLYGISSSGASPLRNVSTLRTTILQIREVEPGCPIGYGCLNVASRPSRIAVIPIGYADGFDRKLGNGAGEVWINGALCPVAGNICMDTTLIDVTGVDASEGDPVIIFGNELPAAHMAAKLGTIPYEVLTSISPRVKRVYYSN